MIAAASTPVVARDTIRAVATTRTTRTTAAEEAALAARARRGDVVARNELIERNLPLAWWLADRWWRRTGLPREDLRAVAAAAMLDAAAKFRPERGRFASCVAVYVLRDLGIYVGSTSRLVRVPANKARTMPREALAPEPPHLVSPESREDPDRWIFAAEVRRAMTRVLSDVEATVITLRFGLDGGDGRTLQEIGRVVGLSRERVRQLEAGALVALGDALAIRAARR